MLIRLALRNILRNRRRSAITLLVIVFGSVALILFGGYKAQTFRGLRESTIRGRTGHMQIFGAGYSEQESRRPLERGLDDLATLRRVVESDSRVKYTAAQISVMGLISNGVTSETFLATAVEPAADARMEAQRVVSGRRLREGETDAVLLGRGLATSLAVKDGDVVTLMTTTVTGSLNAVDLRVVGIFMTGVKEFDDRAARIPLASAQQLLQTSRVEKLLVFLHRTEDTQAVAGALTSRLKGVEIREWPKLATFYHQVVALYNGIFGFLGIVVFAIVVLSVANTMVMAVFERTREIGTLMAIGTTRSRLWRMFLAEGFLTGVLGAVAGLAAGVAISLAINGGNVMLPPPPGYTTGYRLQIDLEPAVVAVPFVVSIVTATLSAIVPAVRGTRIRIVDALGHI